MHTRRLFFSFNLAWLSCLAPAVAQQVQEEPTPVRLSVEGPEQLLFPGQWATVRIQLEVDAEFREESMLQLFPRPLEVPLDLQTIAWTELEGLEWQPLSELNRTSGQALAWDGQQIALQWELQQRDERATWVAQTSRSVRGLQAGIYQLPAARVRYATATRFETDLLGDRIPVDEQRLEVLATPLSWEVSALPLAGQPAAFRGALGEWKIEVEKQVLSTTAQGDVRLIYHLQPAALANSSASVLPDDWRPSFEDDQDWQVLGILNLPAPVGESRLQIDLRARRSGELWSPTWSVVSFLAEQSSYVQVELPRWRISASSAFSAAETGPDASSFSPATQSQSKLRLPPGFFFGVVLGAVLLALGALLRQGMRQRVTDWASEARLGDERAAISVEREFVEWLAGHLDWPVARMIQPQLATALQEHGISEQLARHTAEWLREVEAARYGGPPVVNATARLQALRDAWSRHVS